MSGQGLVEWVENSFDLQHILDEYADIRLFFQAHDPSNRQERAERAERRGNPLASILAGTSPAADAAAERAKFSEEILDNFVRSCAGYCVISFLLGIGDRHLENLMLTTDGRLFHIDFEYILGHDPKPFAPPMKLSEQMVMAMGGRSSRRYLEFQKVCCKAYLILRKHARTFLNLLDLSRDLNANHNALSFRSGQELEERFQLHLSPQEAVTVTFCHLSIPFTLLLLLPSSLCLLPPLTCCQYLQEVIHESVGALFPQLVDTVSSPLPPPSPPLLLSLLLSSSSSFSTSSLPTAPPPFNLLQVHKWRQFFKQ
eukprot:754489-Hanusia_phi.AAC.2